MLVTFKTSAYADITMFGDAAEALLKLMGQSGNVPGAIMADEVAAALAAMQASLEDDSAPGTSVNNAGDDQLEDDEDRQNKVALSTRAIPLIQLLEAAIAAKQNVMWDK